jgi:hypothetical protein
MKFSKVSFRGAEDVCFSYLVSDKVQWRVFVNTITKLSGSMKAGNFFADRATDALRSSSGVCPIGYLTLNVEATMQSQNVGGETFSDGAQYTSSRGVLGYFSVMATLKCSFLSKLEMLC